MEFAHPLQRIFAWLVDLAVLFALILLIHSLFYNPEADNAVKQLFLDFVTFKLTFSSWVHYFTIMSNDRSLMFFISAVLIYTFFYVIIPCLTNGYTIGKIFFQIRVVKLNEKKMSFGTMFLRQILGSLVLGFFSLGITYIISGFSIFYAKGLRSIQDRMCNTLVVKDNPLRRKVPYTERA
ncbi:MAG: RDD family protein [Bacilli bacterium]|jgi:uncharacterized RDD family membrane protein YckC